MERNFLSLLHSAGVSSTTLDVLKDEHILTLDIFVSLEEEHFTALSQKIKIGQHALLLRLWHQKTAVRVITVYTHFGLGLCMWACAPPL